MSKVHPSIAQRELVGVDQNGREFDITIAIGAPYSISRDEWACPVRADGLHSALKDIHGADSWQAMQLAYQLIVQLLGHFTAAGGRLLLPESREPISVKELVPKLR